MAIDPDIGGASDDGARGDAWGAVGVKRMIAKSPGIKRQMSGDEGDSSVADEWGGNLPRHAKGGRIKDDEDEDDPDEMCEGGRPRKKKGGKAEGRMEERRLDRRPRKAAGGRTTPSGGVKASYRHKAETQGHTMPGGSFPIEDKEDLRKAKHDVGRASNPAAARRWIDKRAHELGEPALGESKD